MSRVSPDSLFFPALALAPTARYSKYIGSDSTGVHVSLKRIWNNRFGVLQLHRRGANIARLPNAETQA